MGRPMGLGNLGGSNLVFKRKFRWTFQVQPYCGRSSGIPEYFVKTSARPNVTIADTEINFLNGKMWIPGKASWETITVTFYDLASADAGGIQSLYGWLATVYNFTDPVNLQQSSRKGDRTTTGYGADGTLTLYDGCGNGLERWTLRNMFPSGINFGDLDYSSSDEATIELTIRYSDVQYENLCGGGFEFCCDGCGPASGGVAGAPLA